MQEHVSETLNFTLYVGTIQNFLNKTTNKIAPDRFCFEIKKKHEFKLRHEISSTFVNKKKKTQAWT